MLRAERIVHSAPWPTTAAPCAHRATSAGTFDFGTVVTPGSHVDDAFGIALLAARVGVAVVAETQPTPPKATAVPTMTLRHHEPIEITATHPDKPFATNATNSRRHRTHNARSGVISPRHAGVERSLSRAVARAAGLARSNGERLVGH